MKRPGVRRFLRECLSMGLIVCGMVAPAMAADARQGAENSTPLPSYQSETQLFAGYRLVNLDDSERAGEYQDLHSSLTVGIDALSCPLPHRFHLNGEFLNKNDVYADTGYAYSDLLLFRDIFVRVHHNLDHSDYQYSGEPPNINYEDRNVGARYSTDVSNNFLSLRLKAPNFPFHIFLKHRYVDKEGSIQQRFLLGGFENIHKISETRRIDWRSNAITLGVNSHLGPMEIEYTHDFSRFDPGGDNVLYDYYPAAGTRPADIYPHNVIPETESRANSLKLHTSYTGRIVASMTLDNGHRKNNYSGAVADTWQGAVDVSWVSDPSLMFFFKYRHRDLTLDNPDSVTLSGLAQTMTYPVRRSISSRKDIFSLSASFRPISRLTIIPAYHFEHLARQDSAAWRVLPKYTDIHSIKLTAYARPLNQLKVKAIYDYKYYDHPAYNIEPDSSNQIRFSTTYLPTPKVTALLDYSLTLSTRDHIKYLNVEPDTVVDGGKRKSRNDRFLGSLSFMLSPKASLTASWAYYRGEVDQDLAYGKWDMGWGGDLPYIDPGVPYTNESNSYSLSLNARPRDDITFIADINYTISAGELLPGTAITETPDSLTSFSALKVSETVLSIGITKKLRAGWKVGLKLHSDIYHNGTDDRQDGTLYVTTFSLKRSF
ncbi:MAG: MtrB/PioB family outer membrane beta-barrel protein [Deltaproteobacteria bacterium]|nr:MtrB/PioB family outer membrane beta-barrel protein [Deltaproteobacteria bacterium]